MSYRGQKRKRKIAKKSQRLNETELQRLALAKERAKLKSAVVKTGISGFDKLTAEGGLPVGTSVLVAGGPGTGKTIFCLQTLYNAAREGQKCFYLSFEESPERLRQRGSQFGWNVGDLVKKGLLTIKRMDPLKVARSVEALFDKATGQEWVPATGISELTPKGAKPQIVVVDSVTALESAFTGKPENYRIYIEQLFRILERIRATSFIITETEAQEKYSRTGVEEFLADGVIALYNFRAKHARLRGIEIVKLRGGKHMSGMVPMEITSEGIEIFPGERFFEAE